MKSWVAFMISCLLLCSLTGCAGTGRPSAEHPVTLTMWHVYGSQTSSPLNDVIAQFNSTVGREEGILIEVESVTSSSAIDEALAASASGRPGAEALPDLFTAYPRVAEIVGEERLLAWDAYFSEEELAAFHSEFLAEGEWDGKLLMLPIAKSTEAFYLNQTLFDRFSAETGITELETFADVFDAATAYYTWSGGKQFMQMNDYYHYAYAGMEAAGAAFVVDGKLQVADPAFAALWEPLAAAAIQGGICLEDGYAASKWKTVEIIANTGSTADVLYQPDRVIYADNTTESIEITVMPYPTFAEGRAAAVYRGGGLFAMHSDDERKNDAAARFAKWLTETEHNLAFVTQAGYLPVTQAASEGLAETAKTLEQANYRQLYAAVDTMLETHTLHALPRYPEASEVQADFEEHVRAVLRAAQYQYVERTKQGENPETVVQTLTDAALQELIALTNQQE